MGLLDTLNKPMKLSKSAPPPRRKPADKWKDAGSREYQAKWHDRQAARLEMRGDLRGAEEQRQLAASLREPPPRR